MGDYLETNIDDEEDVYNDEDADYEGEEEQDEDEQEQEVVDLDTGLDFAEVDVSKYVQPSKNDFNEVMKKSEGFSDANHISDPYMTKYEYTRIRGTRLQQLASGSPPFVIVPPHVSSIEEIFELEFEQKKLPFIVKRPLPNGEFEYWKFKNLVYLPTLTKEGKPKVSLV